MATQKVCIVGGGVAGVGLWWTLAQANQPGADWDVTIIHDGAEFGGHALTVPVQNNGGTVSIESGATLNLSGTATFAPLVATAPAARVVRVIRVVAAPFRFSGSDVGGRNAKNTATNAASIPTTSGQGRGSNPNDPSSRSRGAGDSDDDDSGPVTMPAY